MKTILFLLVILSMNSSAYDDGYAYNEDTKIFYVDYGPADASPILLVQGLGGQLTFWPPELVKMLQNNGFRPIVYDNRDVGLSQSFEEYGRPNFLWNYFKWYTGLPMQSVYSLSDMAGDGIAILDKLQIEKSHILGISMGGMISQRMVYNHQNRFISYIQVASMAKVPDHTTLPRNELRKIIEDRSYKDQSIEERVDKSIRLFEILSSEGASIDREKFSEEVVKNIERSPNETGFSRHLQAILADKDRYELIREIEVPTLVIHGKIDPLIPFDEGKKSAEMIPNSTFLAVEKMSHLLDPPIIDIIEEPLVGYMRLAESL
jgi:pimeloyl-ACP methyl ester carboxylesterase|tara:strand:- start:11241 stop:12197 length:957 start_codon:yes stop_codon:yes gene_type:complete